MGRRTRAVCVTLGVPGHIPGWEGLRPHIQHRGSWGKGSWQTSMPANHKQIMPVTSEAGCSPDPSPKETELQRQRPCPRSPREDRDKELSSSCQVFYLFHVETANPGFAHPDLCSFPFFKSIQLYGLAIKGEERTTVSCKGSPKLTILFILLRNGERKVPAPQATTRIWQCPPAQWGHVKLFCLGAGGLQQVGKECDHWSEVLGLDLVSMERTSSSGSRTPGGAGAEGLPASASLQGATQPGFKSKGQEGLPPTWSAEVGTQGPAEGGSPCPSHPLLLEGPRLPGTAGLSPGSNALGPGMAIKDHAAEKQQGLAGKEEVSSDEGVQSYLLLFEAEVSQGGTIGGKGQVGNPQPSRDRAQPSRAQTLWQGHARD